MLRFAALLSLLASSTTAMAANLNHYGPGRAGPGLFSLDTADLRPQGGWGARLTYSLSDEPLACVSPDGQHRAVAIESAHLTSVAFAWSPVDVFELSLGLPVQLLDVRLGPTNGICGFNESPVRPLGLNDPELRARWQTVKVGPLAVTLRGGLRAPVAGALFLDAPQLNLFGDAYGSGLVGVTFGFRMPRFVLVADVGYMTRFDEKAGAVVTSYAQDALTFGVGGEVSLPWHFALAAELNGRFVEVVTRTNERDLHLPLEAIAGIKYRAGGFEVALAGGVGLTEGVGTPAARVVTSVAYRGDGLTPFDWLRDLGRCSCLGGLADALGEARATRSPVPPARERRPAREPLACPEPGSLEAGVVVVPGCPSPLPTDTDGSGEEERRTEPVVDDLFDDEDARQEVRAARELVVVLHVTFEHDVATLAAGERERLRREVRLAPANADLTSASVDAHADATGTDAYNLRLSSQRAASVIAVLVEAGVPRERIVEAASGASDPLVDDRTHGANRRARIALRYQLPVEAP